MKILIVDDEEMIREVLREYVEFEGNEAFEAEDGMQAVRLCRDNDYDLVLMDVMMPHLDGYSAVKEIKKALGALVVLAGRAFGVEPSVLFKVQHGLSQTAVVVLQQIDRFFIGQIAFLSEDLHIFDRIFRHIHCLQN